MNESMERNIEAEKEDDGNRGNMCRAAWWAARRVESSTDPKMIALCFIVVSDFSIAFSIIIWDCARKRMNKYAAG